MKDSTLAMMRKLSATDVMLFKEQIDRNSKNVLVAYFWLFFFGLIGAHRFYLRQYGWGLLYVVTLGFCGIMPLIDLLLTPVYVAGYNDRLEENTVLNFMMTNNVEKE